jgi:NAD-dependent dihydropyrimidine dehydrogenase PreA subunit
MDTLSDKGEKHMVDLSELDFKPKPIDRDFLSKPDEFPVNGEHVGHTVRAQGFERLDNEGKPYPTKLGIHGTQVGVDWDCCIADGGCLDVCPTQVYEWALNLGQMGTGNDHKIEKGSEEWNIYRTDKTDMVREQDCIFCMACETVCPVQAIKITPP